MSFELSVTTKQGNQDIGFSGQATNLASLQTVLLKYLISMYLEERPSFLLSREIQFKPKVAYPLQGNKTTTVQLTEPTLPSDCLL